MVGISLLLCEPLNFVVLVVANFISPRKLGTQLIEVSKYYYCIQHLLSHLFAIEISSAASKVIKGYFPSSSLSSIAIADAKAKAAKGGRNSNKQKTRGPTPHWYSSTICQQHHCLAPIGLHATSATSWI